MARHLLHGLVVDSPVTLQAGRADVGALVDVRVSVIARGKLTGRGPILVQLDDPGRGRHIRLHDMGDSWFLDFVGTMTATISEGGRSVVITPYADPVPDELLTVLVGGPLMSIVSLVRGHSLLHASAVVTDQVGAWGFFGPSGSGKSELALGLAEHAETMLLSDDALAVEVTGDVSVAHRGTTGSRLRRPGDSRAGAWSGDGRWVVQTDASVTSARLDVLVLPLLSPKFERLSLETLLASAATVALASAPAVEGIVDLRLRRIAFEAAASVVASGVPVVRACVPWNQPGADRRRVILELAASLKTSHGRRGTGAR